MNTTGTSFLHNAAWAFIASGIFIFLLWIIYYMATPALFDAPEPIAFIGMHYPFSALLITFGCLLAALLAYYLKRKILSGMFLACVLLSLYIVLWPMVSLYRCGAAEGIPLNAMHALIRKTHAGEHGNMKTISFGTASDGTELLLDHWPSEKPGPRPAIIRMHGGGWVYGNKSDLLGWNRWLNKLGYHVFDVGYRMPPAAIWKDEVGDVKCALSWVVENALKNNVDTGKLVLMGNSAGASLALLAAYSHGSPMLAPSCGTMDVAVDAVINIYGPVDMISVYEMTGGERMFESPLFRYIGGSPQAFPERYRLLSPLNHITAGAPPTLTLHGENDRVTPVNHAYRLDQSLNKSGVIHELVLLPVTDHGFDLNWSSLSSQIARARVKLFLDHYVK